MTIRTKVWLLAAIVAVTAGATVWLHAYALRRELTRQAKDAAIAVVKEIADALAAPGRQRRGPRPGLRALQTYSVAPRPHPADRAARRARRRRHGFGAVHRRAPRGSGRRSAGWRRPSGWPTPLHPAEPTGDNSLPAAAGGGPAGARKATLLLHWNLGAVEAVLLASERWAMLLGAVQLVALVLLVGFLVDRTVVKRLDALGAAMRDVEGGDLGRRVQTQNAEDEVGRLSHGFNRMLDQLSAADSEIRAFNQRLAQEIAAATQDLSKKNVALAQMNRLLIDLRRENASRVRLATLGQLAAQLAHEIGTPLSSVNGPPAAGAAAAGPAPGAARAAGGVGAGDRPHRPDRARLPGFDPLDGARAQAGLAAQDPGRGGGGGGRRRASRPGADRGADRATTRRTSSPTRGCCGRS